MRHKPKKDKDRERVGENVRGEIYVSRKREKWMNKKELIRIKVERRQSYRIHTHTHTHTHTNTHTNTHTYIYIYIYRERERDRGGIDRQVGRESLIDGVRDRRTDR